MTPGEARVVEVARLQHHVFTRAQAREAGVSASTIRRRVAAGIRAEIHPRVLVIGTSPPTLEQRMVAAMLQVSGSCVSHRSALALRGIADTDIVHVSHLGKSSTADGVFTHGTGSLPPEDLAVLRRIPTTTPERALIDALTDDASDADELFDACVRDRRFRAQRLMERSTCGLRAGVGAR